MENESEYIDTENLITVKNFAKKCDVTTSFIYKLEKDGVLSFTIVDGVYFVDKEKYQRLSDIKSTKKLLKTLKLKIKTKKNAKEYNLTKKPSI